MSNSSIHDDDDDDDIMLFAAAKKWADAQEENDGENSIKILGGNSGDVDAANDKDAMNLKTKQVLKKDKKDKKNKDKRKDKKKLKTRRSSNDKDQTTTNSSALSVIDKGRSSSDGDVVQDDNNKSQPYNPSSTIDIFERSQRSRPQQNKYSLHVTNLPYTATKDEIIKIFTSHGCKVTSTRLVYNYHKKTLYGNGKDDSKLQSNLPSNGFTGVAFVDLVDQVSFEGGLKLNKVTWSKATATSKGKKNDAATAPSGGGKWGGGNRRMNVRPTRTKEELANIVKRTKEKLALAREQQKKEEDENANASANDVDNVQSHGDNSQQHANNKIRINSFSDKKGQEKNKQKTKSKHSHEKDEIGKSAYKNDKSYDNVVRKKRKNNEKEKNEKNGTTPSKHKKHRKAKKKSKDHVQKEKSQTEE